MLSLFPEILFLAPFSAFLIRISAALVFGYGAWKHLPVPAMSLRAYGVAEGLCALLLFFGVYVQAAAIVGFVLALIALFVTTYRTIPRSTMILLAVLSISLVVTGAGPFAFDLPL